MERRIMVMRIVATEGAPCVSCLGPLVSPEGNPLAWVIAGSRASVLPPGGLQMLLPTFGPLCGDCVQHLHRETA